MKMKQLRAGLLLMAAGGTVLLSGCVVEPDGRVFFQPLVVAAPAPVVVVDAPGPVMVPDSYVWDGVEYVGVVGDQYFYLGPGNVWLVCDPFRLERFRGWDRTIPVGGTTPFAMTVTEPTATGMSSPGATGRPRRPRKGRRTNIE